VPMTETRESPTWAYLTVVGLALAVGLARIGIVDEFVAGVVRGLHVQPHAPLPAPLPPFAVIYRFGTFAFMAAFLVGVTSVAARRQHWSHALTLASLFGLLYLVGRAWLWWELPDDTWPPHSLLRAQGLLVSTFGVAAVGSLIAAVRGHVRAAVRGLA
jgi:ammonia channel protein AmtB